MTSSITSSAETAPASVAHRPGGAGRRMSEVGQYVVMTVLAAFFLFPLVYMLASSFKSDGAVLSGSDSLQAFAPTPFVGLENYGDAAQRASFFRVFANSVIISGAIVGLGLIVNSLLGYALARLRFAGRALIVVIIIALIIIPFEALAVPLLFMSAELGWLDTYHVQILPFIANPLFIYLFYTFFLSVPVALEEAARIDGAGTVRIFVSVVAPMAKPAYATMAILGFMFSWGQLLWPVMVTRGIDVRPLPLGIGTFKTTPPVQWGDIMAYATMMTVPLLIVFLLFQRYFVAGVASSGVKG